jgi:hypothetical protein
MNHPTLDHAVSAARLERLNQGLLALGSWCRSRAIMQANERTTMTVLRRKVDELTSAVDRAGWGATNNYWKEKQ